MFAYNVLMHTLTSEMFDVPVHPQLIRHMICHHVHVRRNVTSALPIQRYVHKDPSLSQVLLVPRMVGYSKSVV
jgi:hypothetical protein